MNGIYAALGFETRRETAAATAGRNGMVVFGTGRLYIARRPSFDQIVVACPFPGSGRSTSKWPTLPDFACGATEYRCR
ncbi:hypothetical protein [Nocardia australiensis]|uniref:hypothetical protein n=1 Tax=Nocardia australiensis TaxID=2887191 RepID=UPI001D14FC66|nr:hypothetical protein [Nocardia australiensis]